MSELLFASGDLSAALQAQRDQLKQAVENADPMRIRTEDVGILATELSARGRVEPLELLENDITISQINTKIDVSGRFEYAWEPEDGPLFVDGIELTLHVPFRGDSTLLRLRPSRYTLNPPRGVIRGREIILVATGPPQDAERIQAHLRQELEMLKQHAGTVRDDVTRHNQNLPVVAGELIESRRRRLSQIPDLTSAFGFPVRPASSQRANTSEGMRTEPSSKEPIPAASRKGRPAETRAVLHVFLCHASQDKQIVRSLHDQLSSLPVDLWLDETKLLPGQNWEREIRNALRTTHVVLVCLSRNATTKEGFVQKEIKIALDVADEKPEGTIFVIPVRLEECPLPERLRAYHWVDLFNSNGIQKLVTALKARADDLRIPWPQ